MQKPKVEPVRLPFTGNVANYLRDTPGQTGRGITIPQVATRVAPTVGSTGGAGGASLLGSADRPRR